MTIRASRGRQIVSLERRRFRLGVDPCAYCATAICEDREDPIPLALYPRRVRSSIQFLKIPACRSCNDAKSRVDGALRDFLTINIESQRHPVATELFGGTVIRAAENNRVRLLDQFFEGREVQRVTPSGIFIELAYEVPYDHQPINDAVVWLTRGMHWAVYGRSVDAASTLVWLIPPEEKLLWVKKFHGYRGRNSFTQGDPFTCGWVATEDGDALWAHSFFDSVLFMAVTRPRKPESHQRA